METVKKFDPEAFKASFVEKYEKYLYLKHTAGTYGSKQTSRDERDRMNKEAAEIYNILVNDVAEALKNLPLERREEVVKATENALTNKLWYSSSCGNLMSPGGSLRFWQDVAMLSAGEIKKSDLENPAIQENVLEIKGKIDKATGI